MSFLTVMIGRSISGKCSVTGSAIFVLLCSWGLHAAAQPKALTLGVHPFKPATQVVEIFTPLADYLGTKIGVKVVVEVAQDYQTHIERAGSDMLDFAYMGPAPYVQLTKRYGLKRLLARQAIDGQPTFHGKIVVRRDSAIQSLSDLRGKRFLFGDSSSTMAHLVPRSMLNQAGLTVEDFSLVGHVNDHVNIVLAVLAGEYDVGAVKEDVFFAYEAKGLRAIATSPPVSDHVFIASDRLDGALVDAARAALLSLDGGAQAEAVLTPIAAGLTALVPVDDKDYDSLRLILDELERLGIKP